LTLDNCTIVSNTVSGNGGGILNVGRAIINNSSILSNTAPTGKGGAISNAGIITLTNSTVTGNRATNTDSVGGGINNQQGGRVALVNTLVSNNAAANGGGVYNNSQDTGSILELNNSTISGNTATASGSGIYNNAGGTVNQTGAFTVTNDIYNGGTFGGGADTIDLNGSLILAGGTWIATNGTLQISGYLTQTGGTFDSNGGTVKFDGTSEQSFSAAATLTFGDLVITNTAGVWLPAPAPTAYMPVVTGTVVNSGTLMQVQSVPNGSGVEFLHITDGAGADKYFGVVITPTTGNMGNVTVAVRGNQTNGCTTNPTDALIHRCFRIDPTAVQTATIKFWYTGDELNGQAANILRLWHWGGTPITWTQVGANYSFSQDSAACPSGSYCWFQADSVGTYSPFGLGSGPGPTVITLSTLRATTSEPAWPLAAALVLSGAAAGWQWWRRRR
jgi:hypothetical protein